MCLDNYMRDGSKRNVVYEVVNRNVLEKQRDYGC
jgi:hypothetical protein